MTTPRTYPHGVLSWIDTEQPDLAAAAAFYGALFGWNVAAVSAPGAPVYAVGDLGGRDVAGLSASSEDTAAWNTYIAVADADAGAAAIADAGGEVLVGPFSPGPAGRMAVCRDPAGAPFRIWQAGRRPGAQAVNEPGTWNFSELRTDRPETLAFYTTVFGWAVEALGFATLLRVPGYGDHLEATVDPGIRARQAGGVAPPGFEDAVGWVGTLAPGATPHWHTIFAVADRDATAAEADRLGAEILAREDQRYSHTALIRDPQGAVFTASQFAPGEG